MTRASPSRRRKGRTLAFVEINLHNAAQEDGQESDTRERIMQAALLVFSSKGFEAATLKEITELANANIAAVNYYFRSKDELIRQVIQALLGAVNKARREALDTYERELELAGRKPSLHALIEALIRPMVRLSRDSTGGRALISLLLQARASPAAPPDMMGESKSDTTHERFIAAFTKLLPELSREEIIWRYDCARGAMMFVLADLAPGIHRIVQLAGSPSDASDETLVRELVVFVEAGFRAGSAHSDLKS